MALSVPVLILAVVAGLAFLVLISLAILDRAEAVYELFAKGKFNRADIPQ